MAALSVPSGADLAAQVHGLDFRYGRWWHDGTSADVYSLSYLKPWFGPLSYGLGVTHLNDRTTMPDRTHTGGDLSLAIGSGSRGLYGIGSGGLALRHTGGSLDATWSAGVGYALRPLSFLSLAGEARYRVEKDAWTEAFWKFNRVNDRRGWQVQGRMAIHFRTVGPRGAGRPTPPRRTMAPDFRPPSESDINGMARSGGASSSTAKIAASVVKTAIDVMGSPYQWGGTDENGFDCSGLIQYAYAENGVILPRVSRDQARTGTYVEPRVADLRPGDILGFSVERSSRITHVGLYIGDGKFIHSASRGVAISSLVALDGNSRWWQNRWVVARRTL